MRMVAYGRMAGLANDEQSARAWEQSTPDIYRTAAAPLKPIVDF